MAHRVVDKQVIYAGKRGRFELHSIAHEETGTRHVREVLVHPGAVVVLPFLPDGRIVLIRNRRYAVNKVLVELPAGTLEPGEDPMNAAGRELVEEAGYLAGRMQRIGAFYASPGVTSERLFAFAAFDLEPAAVAPDEGEEIVPVPVTFEQAVAAIGNGQIEDAKTIATLLMYDRFHRTQG